MSHRSTILSLFAALLAITYVSAKEDTAVSGQGKMKFRVLYKSDHLPPEAQKVLKGAHGGFTVDLAKGKGRLNTLVSDLRAIVGQGE